MASSSGIQGGWYTIYSDCYTICSFGNLDFGQRKNPGGQQ